MELLPLELLESVAASVVHPHDLARFSMVSKGLEAASFALLHDKWHILSSLRLCEPGALTATQTFLLLEWIFAGCDAPFHSESSAVVAGIVVSAMEMFDSNTDVHHGSSRVYACSLVMASSHSVTRHSYWRAS